MFMDFCIIRCISVDDVMKIVWERVESLCLIEVGCDIMLV